MGRDSGGWMGVRKNGHCRSLAFAHTLTEPPSPTDTALSARPCFKTSAPQCLSVPYPGCGSTATLRHGRK